ncbi:hypothetical protein GCM10009424_17900 [Sphingomonas ursincola]|uniref:Uncharacterized protein n=1 Tax=Sphingomonas ursincola TaxID=56361 RepID=A0A7V8RD43_9SPHN|nr:hypothetical protein [Sphingomonas ursincola]MBA1374239.1 hypothetical protein [Sphingomonas ursincola]
MQDITEAQAANDTSHEARRKRMKTLFQRYPDISTSERDEMVRYLRTAPVLDIGLLKSDESLRYRIAAFEAANARALGASPWEIAALVAIFVFVGSVCVALWDMGA